MESNNFTASASKLTPDFLGDCLKILELAPLPRDECFVNPRIMAALHKESGQAPNLISSMMGMPIFKMENQKADCWVISDPNLAQAYRSGIISEDELKRMNEKTLEVSESHEEK